MTGPAWRLTTATTEQLAVLAECWAVPAADLTDRDRRWVQATAVGDARGPRVAELADRTIAVFAAPGSDNPRWTSRMTGLRGLLRLGSVAGPPPAGVRVLTDADAAAADALHDRCSAADLGAASPHPGDALLAVGVVAGDRLVGVAAAVQPPAGPPEVSVLVDPAYRRQGLAARAEQGLIAAAAGRWVWLQHRTISQDEGSQRLAARCGFALLTREHLVRPG